MNNVGQASCLSIRYEDRLEAYPTAMLHQNKSIAIEIVREKWTPEQDRAWATYIAHRSLDAVHSDPRWHLAICNGLKHQRYVVQAKSGNELVGLLPLSLIKSRLFGRFLVSLPYVNWAGPVSDDADVTAQLIDVAIHLADELDVRFLELRNSTTIEHPRLTETYSDKVHMRLALVSEEENWKRLRSVVRTQIRKGATQDFQLKCGSVELLTDFYKVFSQNMRDLGTPVFDRRLFREILDRLPNAAELCVVYLHAQPIACALAVHMNRFTEVPSASALRQYRGTAVNSWMYWQLILRAIERGSEVFDFGRSTIDGATYKFKQKWAAQPEPACWQYYLRQGTTSDMRPESGKYDRVIKIWQRLPVWMTRMIGPLIVRGIP